MSPRSLMSGDHRSYANCFANWCKYEAPIKGGLQNMLIRKINRSVGY